jgi:AcrR family transcriptional regulator
VPRTSARRAAPQPRGRRLPAGERREQLLDVAAELLLAAGAGALTMERVAERAGVSKGLGYAYFSDAEALALALWDREVAEVYRRVEEAFAGARGLEAQLGRAIAAYFDMIEARGPLLGTLQAHFAVARAERPLAARVRRFVGFWSRRLQATLALERAAATTLAGMIITAVEAAGRSWAAGVVPRARAEALALAFAVAGARGVTNERSPR